MTRPTCECWIWDYWDHVWKDAGGFVWDDQDECPYCGKKAEEC